MYTQNATFMLDQYVSAPLALPLYKDVNIAVQRFLLYIDEKLNDAISGVTYINCVLCSYVQTHLHIICFLVRDL